MGAMMPALMVPPGVMVVAPGAMITKLLRTIFGLDDAAAGRDGIGRIFLVVRINVIIRVVVVPDASDEDAPVVAAMGEAVAAKTPASNRRTGTERAALRRRAAMEVATESSMATISTTTTTAATAAAAGTSSNFDCKSVGHDIACS